MNGFRPNSSSGSDEVYVFGHIFRTGFNQICSPSSNGSSPSTPVVEPAQRSKENALLQFISQLLAEEEDEEESEHRPSIAKATNIKVSPLCPFWLSNPSPNSSGVLKKPRNREDNEFDEYDAYEDVLIYPNSNDPEDPERCKAKRKVRGGAGGAKKRDMIRKEVVDLRSLLLQSAQAAANFDNKTMNDLLLLIRKHSSLQGDSMERAAHCFANALEARMAGTGPSLYARLASKRIPNVDMLKAYRVYIKACPFRTMSNMFAGAMIRKVATRVAAASQRSLHIIDFGIRCGYQWPCLIQALSEMPDGPPKLRITGIDFPQMGYRSAERVVETGCRLARFCERFRVPFVYNAIAQSWDTIRVEDLKIQKDEMLVVNSMYRLHHLPDETDTDNSPRDSVLKLIKKINPDVFVHGVINASYTTPFFATRFKEAFYHFSSMFDMLGATVPPHEDGKRLLLEEQMFEKEAVNAIACEGAERIERPETYKNWQLRTRRGGFRQLSLDQEAVKRVSKAKLGYHKDFSVDEDGRWILFGWKGRIIYAISCWQPDNRSSTLNLNS